MRQSIFLAGLVVAPLACAAPGLAQGVQLQWLSTQKIEQVIGDVDWDADSTTPAPASKTYGNYAVLANGLGYSFDHFDASRGRQERVFLFGDTVAFGTHSDQPVQPGQLLPPVGAAVGWSGSTLQCLSGPGDPTPIDCESSAYNYHGRDPFAWSTTTSGDQQLKLHFFMDRQQQLPLFVKPSDLTNAPLYDGKVDTGGDDIPNSGISLGGRIYMVYSTGSSAGSGIDPSTGCPASHRDSYSTLVRFLEPGPTFQTLREVSYVTPGDANPVYANEGGHFLFTSLHKFPAGQPSLSEAEPMVLMYGVGWFRCSDVYLAMVPQSDFGTLTNVRFFMGLDGGGQPQWSAPTTWSIQSDHAAQPVASDETATGLPVALPSIGNVSVSFAEQLGLWLMTYDSAADGGRSVYFRYAKNPWGPWDEIPPQIIYDPCRDGGFGSFISYFAKSANDNKCATALPPSPTFPASSGPAGPMIGPSNDPTQTSGTVFAPYMIEGFTRVNGDVLSIYYTMSTWNPYTVVKMRSDFRITRN